MLVSMSLNCVITKEDVGMDAEGFQTTTSCFPGQCTTVLSKGNWLLQHVRRYSDTEVGNECSYSQHLPSHPLLSSSSAFLSELTNSNPSLRFQPGISGVLMGLQGNVVSWCVSSQAMSTSRILSFALVAMETGQGSACRREFNVVYTRTKFGSQDPSVSYIS